MIQCTILVLCMEDQDIKITFNILNDIFNFIVLAFYSFEDTIIGIIPAENYALQGSCIPMLKKALYIPMVFDTSETDTNKHANNLSSG